GERTCGNALNDGRDGPVHRVSNNQSSQSVYQQRLHFYRSIDLPHEQLAGESAPDGVGRGGNGVYRNPSPVVYFIHEEQVDVIAEIMMIGKRLIKPGYVCKPVQHLR